MVVFPNAKINIGLRVTGKREDGFHNIESIFYPIPFKDALEAVPAQEFQFQVEGRQSNLDPRDNSIIQAYNLLKEHTNLPPAHFCLYKNLPSGAGLGGGSADGTFALKLLNQLFKLQLPTSQLSELASELGSDCPFFLENKPVKVTGRGEILEPVELNLSGYHIAVVHPGISVSTGKAYQQLTPQAPETPINELVKNPINSWLDLLQNDFENYAFRHHPEIRDIRSHLYQKGALFALMSGSGSAVYGIFDQKPEVKQDFPAHYRVWEGLL